MFKKTLLLALLILVTPQFLQAGWSRTYGTQAWEYASTVQPAKDGGYIFVGYKEKTPGSQGDIWLVKTDAEGDTVWTKTFGGDEDDYGSFVRQTVDGGYVVVGTAESWGYGLWVIKTDPDGDTTWTFPRESFQSGGNCVQQTSDGGYIVAGFEEDVVSQQLALFKLDNLGQFQWVKTLGGDDTERGVHIETVREGGYIISANTHSFGAGEADLWILRIDDAGDTLWTRTYGGAGYDWASVIKQTSDGGYVAVCNTNSFGSYYAWLLRLNDQGDTMWTRLYTADEGSSAYCIQQTQDEGFIIAGERGTAEASNAWLIKIDCVGDTQWTQTYGGDGLDAFSWLELISDGYIVVGETNSLGAGSGDAWLVKTDTLGYCLVAERPVAERLPYGLAINTIGNQIILRYTNHSQGFSAKVFDVSGRQVDELYSDDEAGTIIWGKDAESGVYFIRSVTTRKATYKVVLID